jgi:alpha-1,2-mannosyltransferase
MRAWQLAAIEFLPCFLVSLLLVGFIIEDGTLWPWDPAMVDLDVYRAAVVDLLAGRSVYDTVATTHYLKFIYPPIAAILFVPLALIPVWLMRVVWIAATTWAIVVVLRRCRAPRGVVLGLVAVLVAIAVEPLRTTLGYGQVNTLLMVLVVVDLLPGLRALVAGESGQSEAPAGPRPWRWQGVLIGVAAAIKLTPLLFVVLLACAGRWAAALRAVAVFAGLTLLGWIIMPGSTARFVDDLRHGEFNTGSVAYVGNQSWDGVITRLHTDEDQWLLLGLVIGVVVAGIATIAAAWLWRSGDPITAVGLTGLATCLASPLSWTHHHVWAIVLLLGLLTEASWWPRLIRWAGIAWVGWIALCLPLAILPYGGGVEWTYTRGQSIVANAGPVFGSVVILLIAGLVVRLAVPAALAWARERSLRRRPSHAW